MNDVDESGASYCSIPEPCCVWHYLNVCWRLPPHFKLGKISFLSIHSFLLFLGEEELAAAAAAREAAVAAGLLDPSQLGKLTDSLMDCFD